MLGGRLWWQHLKITPGYGGFAVVVRVTPHHGELESNSQGEGNQVLYLQGGKEEHLVPQKPKILLAILSTAKEEEGSESRDTSKGCKSGLEARAVKPETAMFQGARPLAYVFISMNLRDPERPAE